jgi:hypothetical protein
MLYPLSYGGRMFELGLNSIVALTGSNDAGNELS